jgi:hypothetical protein
MAVVMRIIEVEAISWLPKELNLDKNKTKELFFFTKLQKTAI